MVREKVHMEGKKERNIQSEEKEVNIERRYTEKGYTQRGGTHGGKEMEIHKKRGKGRYTRRGERRGTHGWEEMKVHTKRGKRMYMLRGE